VREKAAALASVQARVRAKLEEDMRGAVGLAHSMRVVPPATPPADDDAGVAACSDACAAPAGSVLAHELCCAAAACSARHAIVQARQRARNAGVLAAHAAAAAAAAERRERARLERLAALKQNDYSTYLKLVRNDTTKRITSLLSRTDNYLAKMGTKLGRLRAAGAAALGGAAAAAAAPGGGGVAAAAAPADCNDVVAPDALKAVLRPYQLAGLRWMVRPPWLLPIFARGAARA
jgi:hypothetical protein